MMLGCGSNQPQSMFVEGYIQSSSILNPDIKGGYRPVNIKVFYLKSDAEFSKASFADLYKYPDKALGDSILHISSHQLLPSQSIEIDEAIPKGLKYIAVVAAFRSLDDAKWKDIKPIPEKCMMCTGDGLWDPIGIKIDRLSVYLDTGAEYNNMSGEEAESEEKSTLW
jgi:type VI secretion system VasD/TssJ family lipoprotein